MFTLTPQEVARFDLGRAAEFVAFWSRFYIYRVKVLAEDFDIDYLAELNIGADLNDDNVRRLLRWKDTHHLTDPILSGPRAPVKYFHAACARAGARAIM